MSETDNIIVDTTTRIFQDLCDPQTINNAQDESWKAPLWSALEESGLTLTWVPDTLGGAGAGLVDGFEVCGFPADLPCRCRLPRPCWRVGCWGRPSCRRLRAP